MRIINIAGKEQLNSFVGKQKYSQFLQAWQWGEFHKIVSGGVWRLGVQNGGGDIVATATIIKKNLPMGKNYFYCPRGPVLDRNLLDSDSKIKHALDLLFDEIKDIAVKEGVMFLRIEPTFDIDDLEISLKKTLDIQPSKTLILNLEKDNEKSLKDMKQKTRYNIKLAEKKDIKIIEAGVDRFDDFWKLMDETSTRDNFRLHGRDYYKSMLEVDNDFIKLVLAEYDNKVIAANILAFFGDTATYVHGCSSDNDRSVMAPYLLQWESIKLAKEKGCKYYDFYGIDEKKWPGVTRFKKGFYGKEIEYPGTFDLAFDEGWYNVYRMFRKVRRTF